MKATLEYDFPDEAESHHHAVHADELHAALWEIHQLAFRWYNRKGVDWTAPADALRAAELIGRQILDITQDLPGLD
jgi:hypothetical protein